MRTQQLVIYRDVFGGWRWEYFSPDGEARDSQFSYDTRSECVADAKRRGLLSHPRATQSARERPLLERRTSAPFVPPPRSAEMTASAG